jgi:hypothetical protein
MNRGVARLALGGPKDRTGLPGGRLCSISSSRLRAEVLGHVTEETGQSPNPQGWMAREGEVVLTTFERDQSEVATGLASDPVAEIIECLREIVPRDVPRQPQALMISSRMKWSRTTLGTSHSSN